MLTSSTSTTTAIESPYTTLQRAMVDRMREMRECVQGIDALSTGNTTAAELSAVAQRHAALLEQLRESSAALRQQMREAERLARSEQRMRDAATLTMHYERTQQLVRSRCARALCAGANVFAMDDVDHDASATLQSDGNNNKDNKMDGSSDEQQYDMHADVAFLDFVAQTREREAAMDAAVDRIHDGVKRLSEQARSIQHELHTQTTMLETTQASALRNQEQVDAVHSRVRSAIRRLGKPKLITYAVCLVILFVLILVIVFTARSF